MWAQANQELHRELQQLRREVNVYQRRVAELEQGGGLNRLKCWWSQMVSPDEPDEACQDEPTSHTVESFACEDHWRLEKDPSCLMNLLDTQKSENKECQERLVAALSEIEELKIGSLAYSCACKERDGAIAEAKATEERLEMMRETFTRELGELESAVADEIASLRLQHQQELTRERQSCAEKLEKQRDEVREIDKIQAEELFGWQTDAMIRFGLVGAGWLPEHAFMRRGVILTDASTSAPVVLKVGRNQTQLLIYTHETTIPILPTDELFSVANNSILKPGASAQLPGIEGAIQARSCSHIDRVLSISNITELKLSNCKLHLVYQDSDTREACTIELVAASHVLLDHWCTVLADMSGVLVNLQGEKSEQSICTICLEDISDTSVGTCDMCECKLICGHVFHRGCIFKWLGSQRQIVCPLCRAPAEIQD